MMEIEEERLFYIDQLIDDIKDALIERKIQREWETTKLFWEQPMFITFG